MKPILILKKQSEWFRLPFLLLSVLIRMLTHQIWQDLLQLYPVIFFFFFFLMAALFPDWWDVEGHGRE